MIRADKKNNDVNSMHKTRNILSLQNMFRNYICHSRLQMLVSRREFHFTNTLSNFEIRWRIQIRELFDYLFWFILNYFKMPNLPYLASVLFY